MWILPMQSTPTLKDTDPHDVFAIETEELIRAIPDAVVTSVS